MSSGATFQNVIPTLGKNDFVAIRVGPMGELVVVGELGIAERGGADAEDLKNEIGVLFDLGGKFGFIVEKT